MTNITRRNLVLRGSAATATAIGGPARARPVSEGFADVPGGKIYWKKVGRGRKPPLLTLHGGPGAAHNYLLPLAALADDRPVIFYDQLGCGRADAPRDPKWYTIDRSVREIAAVRDALSLDRIVLYGHSWGTLQAIEYLCQGRGKGVDAVILSGAFASTAMVSAGMWRLIDTLPGNTGVRLRTLEAGGQTDSEEYKALAQQFYNAFLLRTPPTPDVIATLKAMAGSVSYPIMNGPNEFTITGVIRDWNRVADLHMITQPLLLTTGQYDEVDMTCHTTIRDGVSGPCELAVFDGCSHLIMNEAPKRYTDTLRRYLKGLSAS